MSTRALAALTVTGSEWLNLNVRMHYMKTNRITQEWRQQAHWRAKANKTPAFETVEEIVATLRFTDNRRRDGHNWMPTIKAAIDGLVDAGVLDDDSSRYLRRVSVVIGDVDRALKCPTLGLLLQGTLKEGKR